MDTDSQLIWRFAAIGLLVSLFVFAYIRFSAQFDASLYTFFVALCPPALLCFPFNEMMKEKSGFYAVWSVIGLANAGLYAVVGAAYVGLRKKSD